MLRFRLQHDLPQLKFTLRHAAKPSDSSGCTLGIEQPRTAVCSDHRPVSIHGLLTMSSSTDGQPGLQLDIGVNFMTGYENDKGIVNYNLRVIRQAS